MEDVLSLVELCARVLSGWEEEKDNEAEVRDTTLYTLGLTIIDTTLLRRRRRHTLAAGPDGGVPGAVSEYRNPYMRPNRCSRIPRPDLSDAPDITPQQLERPLTYELDRPQLKPKALKMICTGRRWVRWLKESQRLNARFCSLVSCGRR